MSNDRKTHDRLCNCFGELEPECEGCIRMREVFKEYEWRDAIRRLRKHREKQNPAVYIPPYINGE